MESTVLKLNRSQALVHTVNANVTAMLWPRASGKTTGAIGPRIVHLSEVMPRSQCIYYSDTYERIHTILMPVVQTFLEKQMGLIEDQDYVAFKKPPDHFEKPLIRISKYDHVVSFASGFSLCCASQNVNGSANGYSAQSVIVEEAKFVKSESITTEVLPALRGCYKEFGHLAEYGSQWYVTDKWLKENGKDKGSITWLQKLKGHMKPDLVKAVVTMQFEISRLKDLMSSYSSSASVYKIKNRIIDLELKLQKIRREMVFVSEAEPYENIENNGKKYYRDRKREMTNLEYAVAIENKNQDKVEHSFYPAYVPIKHDYHVTTNNDILKDQSVTVALDYQWRIVPLVAVQVGKLPGKEYSTTNFIAGIHSVYEDDGTIDKTVGLFCDLMKINGYTYNIVNYVYDHTAVGKSPANKPFYRLVEDAFVKRGWGVNLTYIGKASEYAIRFTSIKNMFLKEGEYAIRFNYMRTEFLRTAIQLAGAVSSGGITKKDKSKEKNLSVPATETTDYTEAMDQLLWGLLELKLVADTYDQGFEIVTR